VVLSGLEKPNTFDKEKKYSRPLTIRPNLTLELKQANKGPDRKPLKKASVKN
jgi:hypothetical protein